MLNQDGTGSCWPAEGVRLHPSPAGPLGGGDEEKVISAAARAARSDRQPEGAGDDGPGNAGGEGGKVRELFVHAASAVVPDAPSPLPLLPAARSTGAQSKKPTKTALLVHLIAALFRCVIDLQGRAWAVPRTGAQIARTPTAYTRSIQAAWYQEYGDGVSRYAIEDAWNIVIARAEDDERAEVYLRLALAPDGSTVLDLGTATGEVVIVTERDWRTEPASPVLFRRTELTLPLPTPVSGGSLGVLRGLLNVADDDDFALILAYLVAMLQPDIVHPILGLHGAHGSAKTSAARIVAGVLDPSPTSSRSLPRDEREWAVTASAVYAVVLDNVSRFSRWLSDALCRAATGDAYAARKLYTDDEVVVLAYRRAVIYTAINPGALAADFADRLVRIKLQRIEQDNRREDTDVPEAFRAAHAEILGAVLDLAVKVFQVAPTLDLPRLPRLASFAKLCAGVDAVLGTSALDRYRSQEGDLMEDVIESSAFTSALAVYLEGRRRATEVEVWEVTAQEILDKLDGVRENNNDPRPPGWPRDPVAVAAELDRAREAFRHRSIDIPDAAKSGHSRRRVRVITIEPEIDRATVRQLTDAFPGIEAVEAGTPASLPEPAAKRPSTLAEVAPTLFRPDTSGERMDEDF